ncbi:uncharacterized protein LOC125385266 [Bombus terrestris]|uniref:Uncharacterized protein LOC125385266 n=1 Tax=Bombus terrestris TaxID=30195 RepID=A0A9C6S6E5_BOMTE|nr:uncharacterized protein LOC125385266 [Bombus terrestris]
MATGNELATLRRRRGYYIAQFTRFAKKLDDIEQSGCPEEIDLIQIKDRLEIYETELRAIQNQIVAIDEGEIARGIELAEGYEKLQRRITKQLINIRRSTPSQSTSGASAAGRVSASLKLPEVRIPTFDGALEDWQSFYDSFSSTIDQNEHLAPVQKFYHLRSALTGWAARSIQSLAITESNYAIAIDVLKEKFDCHRQICMRQHELWNCHVFKAKSPKERLEIAKRASLCTNCLGKEHALTQCSAGSCRIWTEPQKTDSLTSPPFEPLQHDLLVTAQVNILNNEIQPFRCRALLDTGSSMNFITERLANSLKLNQRKCSVPIGTLNTLSTISKRYITAMITSIDGTYERNLTFLIIPTIASWVPNQPVDRSTIQIPRNLQLADPRFHRPAPIEILLSAGPTLASLCVGQLDINQANGPDLRLQKTRFGWVIGGSPTSQSLAYAFHAFTTALQADLARFWEIDEGPPTAHISEAERQCEEHFRNHVQRTNEGRYVVALPFNETTPPLGSSKAMAMKRLTSLCRRFQRDKHFEADYHAVIEEYLELGHMTKITTDHCTDDGYFLPHHGVIKESSRTTKLRVVFDGSAPTTTGDRKFQQILWRNSDGEVDTYQLNTVTFGLSAAPYLAIRCLKQLADDEGHRYPRAAMVLQRDFYVDDVLTGADTKDEAQSLRTELIELLKLAGLNIRKWAANDRELLRGLSERDINDKLLLGESQTFKTLGVVWNSFDYSILYSVKINPTTSRITKRTVSSEIAKIYDPLGLLAPVIVRAKMLLQRLWTLKIDWDENVKFPRKTIIKTAAEIELHGFCDTSERAYGACVYLRTITPEGHAWTRLLTARSKVAPLKSQTIPRLELSGALLLTSLATTVLQALPSNISRTVYWTDSTIVLHWINTSPHTLKAFVANRVTEIQQKTHTSDWRHIPTTENPADLISRGQSPEDFLRSTIWQHGPEWLQQPEKYWPTWNPVPLAEIPEQKKATCLSVTPPDHSLLERFSSWPKLIRIAARCLRWRQKQDRGGPLTTHDLTNAHNKLVKLLQLCYFPDEIRTLRTDRNSAVKGKVQRLNPFLDKDEILRVGDRLSHSPMPFTQKHPIILPKSSVTALIIEHEHLLNLHSGTQATLYALRRSYWPIDGLKAVHLELVTDLTSEAFIAARRRFIARRGFCVTIYSDNGANFVGANNELRELRNLLQSDDHKVKVQSFLADRRIEWHFIPPNSPHFGGLWEAAVKSFKRHLRRVAGNELLTFENLNTLIIEIESIFDSRPLTPISSDPNDLLVLTPDHFLIGDALTSFRERDFRDTPSNRLSSWQHIQRVKQHFWRRWHREYLNELNIRNKWSKGSHDIREGTVVVLREDNKCKRFRVVRGCCNIECLNPTEHPTEVNVTTVDDSPGNGSVQNHSLISGCISHMPHSHMWMLSLLMKKLFVIAVEDGDLLEKMDHEIDLEYNFQTKFFIAS